MNSHRITPEELKVKLVLLGLGNRREAAQFLGITLNELGKWFAGKKREGIPFGVIKELEEAAEDQLRVIDFFEREWAAGESPPFFFGATEAREYLIGRCLIGPEEFLGYPDGWWHLPQIFALVEF